MKISTQMDILHTNGTPISEMRHVTPSELDLLVPCANAAGVWTDTDSYEDWPNLTRECQNLNRGCEFQCCGLNG